MPSVLRRRALARAGIVALVGVAAAAAFLSPAARAQDAGIIRSGAESYHDTLPGESVNGIGLEFRQLLPMGGLASGELVLANRKDQSILGRGALRFADVPLGDWRMTAEGGDVIQSLDASAYHFANDFLPVTYLRGGGARADTGGISVSAFGGRNEQFRGIRLPTVIFAPESMVGGTVAFRVGEALVLDANALRTKSPESATNPLFGVSVPMNAETYGVGGTFRLAEFWTAQAKASFAQYEYAPDSTYKSGHFLSFVAGSILDAPQWKAQADYIRQGVNYIPLSTASVGNREGPYLQAQFLGERLVAAVSFSDYRNNLESNPGIPDLHSQSVSVSGSYPLTRRVSTTWNYDEQSLTSTRDGETSRFSQRTASSDVFFPTFGYTRLRYQYQTTDEATLNQRLHEVSIEQQLPLIFGVNVIPGVRYQHAAGGASSLLYRGTISGSVGAAYFSFQGEWGHDLAAASVFALNHSQSVSASLSIPLPWDVELRVEGSWNRVSAVVNPESIFVSQITQEQLFAINRHSLLVRLARSFQWGRQSSNTTGLAGDFGQVPYGLVEGFVFQDLNGNGVRDPGEPPAAGVLVELDGGRSARSDASGHFGFPNVIEGTHTVGLDMEVLPVAFNPPRETVAGIQVQRLRPGQHDFGVIPTGSVSGRVEQESSSGERLGFGHAIVTLLPREFSTYTDPEGNYAFSNLPSGRYTVRLEEASLPEGAVVSSGLSEEKALAGGQDVIIEPLVFSLRVEEKPVQKIFEHEQTVQPRAPRRGTTGSSGSSGAKKASRS